MKDHDLMIARLRRLELWAWGLEPPPRLPTLVELLPVKVDISAKPTGISEDIWKTALALWQDEGADDGAVLIARAIQGERNRSKSVAVRYRRQCEDDSDGALAAVSIALAIEEGATP